jgi:HlyD family secretion protein
MNPTLRRWLPRLVILALLAGLAAGVWRYLSTPTPIEVAVATVAYGPVEASVTNTRAGTVKACRRAKLSPQGGGQIARLLVREGDRVKAGQLLIELWNEDLAAQIRLNEEQVGSAQARRNEACAAAAAARREADRQRQLAGKGFISEAAVDQAASAAEVKAATCKAAEAEISAAQARVSAARAGLQRSVLKAPFAGIVAEVSGEQGEYSTPSPPGIPTPPAIDLIDDACLFVSAPVDEVDVPKLKLGLPARIALDAFPGRHFPGHVQRIAPYVLEVEKQARTVDVEVVFEQPHEVSGLRAGYSADAEVILERRERVLRVPTQAVMEGGRVLLLKDGLLAERKLALGLANWEYTEVRSGLADGDQVVTTLSAEGVKAGIQAKAKVTRP